jgi:hypothetical protein
MNEWIDFAIYIVQGWLLWVLMPRQGRQFGAAMIADRDPDWLGAHPEMDAYLKNSTGFLKVWYAWAAISIAVLLAVRLGWRPFGGTGPDWDVLKDWHGLFLIIGLVGWFASAGLWFRWLKRNVPLADRRSATLHPRTTREFLSLPWRVTVEGLTALHLAAWVVVGLTIDNLDPGHGEIGYWGKFALIVAMTVLFAVFAWFVPGRRPGYPDRIFGAAYRRVEIRVAYAMRLAPLVAGIAALAEVFTGDDFGRAAHLALVLLVTGFAAAFVFMRPAAPAEGAPPAGRGRDGMIGSLFGSTIHDSPRAP